MGFLSIFNDSAADTFKDAVSKASNDPIIMIDMQALPDPDRSVVYSGDQKKVMAEIDKIKESIVDQISDKHPELKQEEIEAVAGGVAQQHLFQENSGLSVFPEVALSGQNYCVALAPPEVMDNKSEIINGFLGGNVPQDVIDNFPGTTTDWLKIISSHEGGHCNDSGIQEALKQKSISSSDHTSKKLQAEVTADKNALAEYEQSNPELVQAFKDLRHLAAGRDSEHATGTSLETDDHQVTALHVEAASAQSYMTAEHLNNQIESALEKYNEDPSYENTEAVIKLQLTQNYKENYDDAYARRYEGKDVPEREQTQLLPADVEKKFFEDYEVKREETLQMIEERDNPKTKEPEAEIEAEEVDGIDKYLEVSTDEQPDISSSQASVNNTVTEQATEHTVAAPVQQQTNTMDFTG